jgi:hypothetical protein
MKRALKWIALIFAGVMGVLVIIVIIGSVTAGVTRSRQQAQATSSASASVTPTPTRETMTPLPSPVPTVVAPVNTPADQATVVARRGIAPLYQLIERACDEPDSIDIDSWRIDGDNVIYRVSDYDTEWSSTATTSFAALDAQAADPVFVTEAQDWQSNGCFP